MAQNAKAAPDVGTYIRQEVIPAGMSVKEAAKRLGVGRPALSNLLNGNAALSPEMAFRLETAFGADRQRLLDIQARAARRADGQVSAAKAYVPDFLTIKARQIHEWAEGNLDARQHLAVLLRKLVHSTGFELRQVDFPGYDNAERKGWDGVTDAAVATPWIPAGRTCWEFGTDRNAATKAEKDYAARRSSVPAAERAECSFVFVTPRNWPGKAEWAKAKNASGEWKAVRAYDASDLEQWLEVSIPAQIWLAERLGREASGFETLDEYWNRWSAASDPPMTAAIFAPSIAAHRHTLKAWLEKETDRPFTVAADSKEEALAFLACLFQDEDLPAQSKDLAAVFESASTLRTLAASLAPFIPIVYTDEAERETAVVYRRLHCIVVRHRNAVAAEPDITLDRLRHEDFEKALASMGIQGDAADRLAAESGRSPMILRRRLSRLEAIRRPRWGEDRDTARSLIPMAFIGAWNAKSAADCEILSALARRPYDAVEEDLAGLLQFDDCPVWSAGEYRGVASKIDALFAISGSVTETDFANFFTVAQTVLSEIDPALELPEDQRFAASLYGKARNHSTALREGICESLVLLSVHGNNLLRNRLGTDLDARVSLLVRRLLTPLTIEKLMSQNNGLPRYAEAAPEEFLALIEADLKKPEPVILGLLKPVTSVFSGPSRTGLLWALECLAWKPQNLSRVCSVLARMSRTRIDDNWVNKPISSLQSIFRSWIPQTAASLDERVRALQTLARQYPDIGWQICVHEFDPGPQLGHYSHRPRWRSDASGAGQPVTRREAYDFSRKALDLALAWPTHNAQTLGDLAERLDWMAEDDQLAVWSLIDEWAGAESDETAKAALRERIRRFALTRRGKIRDLDDATRNRAREVYDKLAPSDAVLRHVWLFAKQWVEESVDELDDEEYDYSKRAERVEQARAEALKEIWAERGFDGVIALLAGGDAAVTVGRHVAGCAAEPAAAAGLVRRCLAIRGDLEQKIDGCMQGFFLALDVEPRAAIIKSVAEDADPDQIARLFRCAPFDQNTWRLLDSYGDRAREKYWEQVHPFSWRQHGDGEMIEMIDRLLDAKRPRAAFHAVHMDWERVETSRLKRLLQAVATTNEEPEGSYRLDPYDIGEALHSLDQRAGVSPDEKAHLEFLFIEALDRDEHGIPNLERQIAGSSALFAQAVALTYKRHGEGQDPPEWHIDDPQRRTAVATATYHLLGRIKLIPGTGTDGKIDAEALLQWLSAARQLCSQYGRADMGDQSIGQLLAKAPADETGPWPCLPVCKAMEAMASEHVAKGFRMGVYNARGAVWRGEGGTQERELAAKYRNWAKTLTFEFPYVSGVIEGIAPSYDRDAKREDSEANVRKRLIQ